MQEVVRHAESETRLSEGPHSRLRPGYMREQVLLGDLQNSFLHILWVTLPPFELDVWSGTSPDLVYISYLFDSHFSYTPFL